MASICSLKAAAASKAADERRIAARKERIEKPDLSHAIERLRNGYSKIREEREKKSLIFLHEAPKIHEAKKVTDSRCQARTLENKPCPFRATCGHYCKRHQI
jgi:hypothetical protein